MVKVRIEKGDITEIDADAIVNPANSLMIMGGGVAGVIKRKGGEEIEKEALKYAPVPVGEAIATKGYKLKARYVIHAPTMERPAMKINIENAINAILAALKLANEMNLKRIAFPGMGTGVGGLSSSEGALAFKIAIERYVNENPDTSLEEIILVAYTDDLFEAFLKIKKELDID